MSAITPSLSPQLYRKGRDSWHAASKAVYNNSEPASHHFDRNSSSEELAWLFACPKCSELCRRRWRSVAGGSNLSALAGLFPGSSLSQAKKKDALWVVARERESGGEMEAGGLAIPVSVISPKHPTSHLPCCHIGNPSRRWFSSASLLAYLLELNLGRGFCSNLKIVDEISSVWPTAILPCVQNLPMIQTEQLLFCPAVNLVSDKLDRTLQSSQEAANQKRKLV